MSFELPDLPFAKDALEPHMSAETLSYHYGKHHAGYVKKLNAAVEEQDLQGRSLLELVRTQKGSTFNNAAQVWNHTFFWNCLSPADKSTTLSNEFRGALEGKFRSLDEFKQQFADAAAANFGSGWTWLIAHDSGELEIVNTSDAETPASSATVVPLLTIDVWEHAYYLDHQNDRAGYIDSFWKLVNWDFVSENFALVDSSRKAA